MPYTPIILGEIRSYEQNSIIAEQCFVANFALTGIPLFTLVIILSLGVFSWLKSHVVPRSALLRRMLLARHLTKRHNGPRRWSTASVLINMRFLLVSLKHHINIKQPRQHHTSLTQPYSNRKPHYFPL